MDYRLNRLDEPVPIAVSKPLLTEFGIHHRLETCARTQLQLEQTLIVCLLKTHLFTLIHKLGPYPKGSLGCVVRMNESRLDIISRSTKVNIIQDGQRPRQWGRLWREESCCSDLCATLSTHRRGIRRRVRMFPPHQHPPLLHVLAPSNHSRILDRLEEKWRRLINQQHSNQV